MNTMGAAAATLEWMAARILRFSLLPFARICTFDAIDTIGEYNAPINLPPNLELEGKMDCPHGKWHRAFAIIDKEAPLNVADYPDPGETLALPRTHPGSKAGRLHSF